MKIEMVVSPMTHKTFVGELWCELDEIMHPIVLVSDIWASDGVGYLMIDGTYHGCFVIKTDTDLKVINL